MSTPKYNFLSSSGAIHTTCHTFPAMSSTLQVAKVLWNTCLTKINLNHMNEGLAAWLLKSTAKFILANPNQSYACYNSNILAWRFLCKPFAREIWSSIHSVDCCSLARPVHEHLFENSVHIPVSKEWNHQHIEQSKSKDDENHWKLVVFFKRGILCQLILWAWLVVNNYQHQCQNIHDEMEWVNEN